MLERRSFRGGFVPEDKQEIDDCSNCIFNNGCVCSVCGLLIPEFDDQYPKNWNCRLWISREKATTHMLQEMASLRF